MENASEFLKRLYRIEAFVAAAAYSLLAIIVMFDVIARELFSTSILGTQRVAVYMSIVAGFLGIGLAAAVGDHLRPRVADKWVPSTWQPAVLRLSDLFAGLVFALAGYFAVRYWYVGYSMGDMVPLLDFPLWPIQLVLPYAFISTAVRHLLFAIFPELSPT